MKRFLILISVLFFLNSCSELAVIQVFHGKESKWIEIKKEDVPTIVIESFVLKYPGSVVEKWYKITKNQYIASFKKDSKPMFAVISSSGVMNNEYLNDPEDLYGYDDYDDFMDSDYYD
ncbi:MAG: hypothetical protein HY951_15615 [Bacteroidia bacterium]|nr:hypothetical protein [Bacteroidia bacterium]